MSIFYSGFEKACSIPEFIIYILYMLWYFRLKHLYYEVYTKYLAVTLHVLSKLNASHSLNSANRDSLRTIFTSLIKRYLILTTGSDSSYRCIRACKILKLERAKLLF